MKKAIERLEENCTSMRSSRHPAIAAAPDETDRPEVPGTRLPRSLREKVKQVLIMGSPQPLTLRLEGNPKNGIHHGSLPSRRFQLRCCQSKGYTPSAIFKEQTLKLQDRETYIGAGDIYVSYVSAGIRRVRSKLTTQPIADARSSSAVNTKQTCCSVLRP